MSNQLLDIEPRDVTFIFEVKKQSSCTIRLVNKTDFLVAYKVKTTSPKKYCVRPNDGIVKPKSVCDFVVTMQGQKVAPPDLICKDKFLVQSTIVPDGTMVKDITSSMFVKDDGKHVEDSKLRVILVKPPHSPKLSSEKGASNHMPAHVATLFEDYVVDGFDITSHQEDNNLEDTNLLNSQITGPITLPSHKIMQDVEIIEAMNIQNYKDSEYIIEPQKEIIEDIGLQKHMPSEEMNAWKNEFSGDASSQKDNTIKVSISSTKHDSEDRGLQKHGTSEDINKWKNDTTGDTSFPDSKAASTAPESVLSNSVVGEVAVEFGMKKAVTNLELVKYIESLKSKLDGLESQLRKAETTISKLTAERRLSSLELKSLRNEVASNGTTVAGKSVQAGFPFLYVVVVAFISMVLGYRFHC